MVRENRRNRGGPAAAFEEKIYMASEIYREIA